MRKTLIIISVGIFVILFPLLALPPYMEALILAFIGVIIIIFGFYERIAHKEKNITHISERDLGPEKELNQLDSIEEEEYFDY